MMKTAMGALACALAAGAAGAQVTDATTAPSWAGPYVGVQVGYGFDQDSLVTDTGETPNNLLALSTGIRPSKFDPTRHGILGGGQAGFNLQSGNIVYGVEGDFSFLDSRGTQTYRSPQAILTFPAGRRASVTNDVDWIGTARGRVGYAVGNAMIFATGGYAFGKIKGSAEFDGDTESVVNYSGRHSYVGQGWTAGGGAELHPFTSGMLARTSIKMDALYYDLGKSHIYALQKNTPPGSYTLGVDTKGVMVRVGMNYAF